VDGCRAARQRAGGGVMTSLDAIDADRLHDLVTASVAAHVKLGPHEIDPDRPLSRLGLDSLRCIELGLSIERAVGRPVPTDLVTEYATLRSVCAALGRHEEDGRRKTEDGSELALMRADAILPPDIRPRRRARAASVRSARCILLTGATGFVGRSILRTLLRRTDAIVICLVRSTTEPAAERVARLLPRSDRVGSRVEALEGDLCEPSLGLSDSDRWRLANRIDAVCHAGAAVNWAAPYAALRTVNTIATRELLRLASTAGALFQFVSSLSVCYSTRGPRRGDERFDPLPYLEGLHFGYAQSKAVAEALVRQARARGLRAEIHRPALVSGDSLTGAFNRDDLLARLIAGCVRMRTAPDLDWRLDCVPVDFLAEALLRLSGRRAFVSHIAHPHPRHWRECVLWMRVYGYPIELAPYAEWSRQLERECAAAPDHPLAPLRGFLLSRHAGGFTLPELHEEARRTQADASVTRAALDRRHCSPPPLDAALLDRYFRAFRAEGLVPAPDLSSASASPREVRAGALRTPRVLIGRMLPGARVRRVTNLESGQSIIGELTAWRSGAQTGLFLVDLDSRRAILKLKARDRDAVAVGAALAAVADRRLGDAYAKWGAGLGLTGSHVREIAIYRQRDPRFRRHTPHVLATRLDPRGDTWAVLLERVDEAIVMDAVDRPDRWRAAHIAAAIDGLAALHAIWWGRERQLAVRPWIGDVRSTFTMRRMAPLWETLADHAAPAFASWTDGALAALPRTLIDRLPAWRPALERLPQTLIHNDFNPRNVCLRRRGQRLTLCAFDWELATIGAPQRDLAELLCFVCGPDATEDEVARWIERHRHALEIETGAAIDPALWRAGFAAALYELLIDRLAVYALVHRVRPQPFLPRVVRTWLRLYGFFRMTEGRGTRD